MDGSWTRNYKYAPARAALGVQSGKGWCSNEGDSVFQEAIRDGSDGSVVGPHGVPVVGIKQRAFSGSLFWMTWRVGIGEEARFQQRRRKIYTETRAWELVEVLDRKICQQVLHVIVRDLTSDLGQEYWAWMIQTWFS